MGDGNLRKLLTSSSQGLKADAACKFRFKKSNEQPRSLLELIGALIITTISKIGVDNVFQPSLITRLIGVMHILCMICLLYTSDAADE